MCGCVEYEDFRRCHGFMGWEWALRVLEYRLRSMRLLNRTCSVLVAIWMVEGIYRFPSTNLFQEEMLIEVSVFIAGIDGR